MAFSSSDSPEDRLGAGDGVSERPATAGSAGGVLRATVGEGEDGKGELTEGKRGHSTSVELSVGVGRRLGVKGDSLGLGQDWVTSVNSKKVFRLVNCLSNIVQLTVPPLTLFTMT